MSSPQNIPPYPSNFQGTPAMPRQKTTFKFKKVVCEEILRRVRRYSSANKDIPFKTPLFIYSVSTPFFVK
jgi:hypothetical protein